MKNSPSAGLLTAVALLALSAGCSGYNTESGCETDPSSSDLAVGASTEVEIEIVNGGWNSLDVAGGYWSTDSPVPEDASDSDVLIGVATLVTGDGNTSEQLTSGSIAVKFSTGEVVLFEGPISCN